MKKLNEPCPCGSQKLYGECCSRRISPDCDTNQIREIVKEAGYADDLADIISHVLCFVKRNDVRGMNQYISSALYNLLHEAGYNAKLCAGAIECRDKCFENCWIELDGKVIDLGICYCTEPVPFMSPIVLDVNIDTKEKYVAKYGIFVIDEYGEEFKKAMRMSVSEYLFADEESKNLVFSILNGMLPDGKHRAYIMTKYRNCYYSHIVR